MSAHNQLKEIITNLSKNGPLFYYGSTAYFNYKRENVKICRILTNLNIALISQSVKNIEFDRESGFDCFTVLDDGTLLTFLTEEFEIKDNYSYLKSVAQKHDNLLFNFFYSPVCHKYYILKNGLSDSLKKTFQTGIYDKLFVNMGLEDFLDYALILSELNIGEDAVISEQPYMDNNGTAGISDEKIKSLAPYIALVLTGKNPYNALSFLHNAGLLKELFRFLYPLRGINQDRFLHPEGDVFEHTIGCFKNVRNPSLRLSFGLLLHDYGKSDTKHTKGFLGHSQAGSKKVRELLAPMGYNREFIRDVEFLVEYHMVNSYYFSLSDNEKSKLFNNDLGIDLLKLFKADLMGSIGRLDSYLDIISDLKRLQKKSFKNKLLDDVRNMRAFIKN